MRAQLLLLLFMMMLATTPIFSSSRGASQSWLASAPEASFDAELPQDGDTWMQEYIWEDDLLAQKEDYGFLDLVPFKYPGEQAASIPHA